MDVDYINPFIKSAANVFDTMLNFPIKRSGIELKQDNSPTYDVTAVIGLSGKASGSVVFSLSRPLALKVVEQILGGEYTEVDADVTDAVGEITNMIAGGAKSGLTEYELSLGLPNIIVGRNHSIHFPGNVSPLRIQFETPWGPMALEVGLHFPATDAESAGQQANVDTKTPQAEA